MALIDRIWEDFQSSSKMNEIVTFNQVPYTWLKN